MYYCVPEFVFPPILNAQEMLLRTNFNTDMEVRGQENMIYNDFQVEKS
jgi:hypothetical protein